MRKTGSLVVAVACHPIALRDVQATEVDASPAQRVRPADHVAIAGWAIRATVADRLHAARARLPRPRVPSLAIAPACASFAVVAALVFVQPRPEAIAPLRPPTRRNMLPPRRRRRLRHPAAGWR
jgi:hypothetical protein